MHLVLVCAIATSKQILDHTRRCPKYPPETFFLPFSPKCGKDTGLARSISELLQGLACSSDWSCSWTDTISFQYICVHLHGNWTLSDNWQFHWNTEWFRGVYHLLASCVQHGIYAARAVAAGRLVVPCAQICHANRSPHFAPDRAQISRVACLIGLAIKKFLKIEVCHDWLAIMKTRDKHQLSLIFSELFLCQLWCLMMGTWKRDTHIHMHL